MFSPECEEKVDPDRIQLPGTRGHSLNALEEFELDYSQVGREGKGRSLALEMTLSSQSCRPSHSSPGASPAPSPSWSAASPSSTPWTFRKILVNIRNWP